jgi:hypothetical protein
MGSPHRCSPDLAPWSKRRRRRRRLIARKEAPSGASNTLHQSEPSGAAFKIYGPIQPASPLRPTVVAELAQPPHCLLLHEPNLSPEVWSTAVMSLILFVADSSGGGAGENSD